jgi:cytochrome c-type biogenesis protein CcmH
MDVWAFWAAAVILVAGVAATLARAMWRARADDRASTDFDLAVYRDQLTEIERDIARDTIPADEGARLRTEIQRRLLEADRAARAARPAGQARAGRAAVALVSVTLLLSLALYWKLGAPGYPDLPLQQRFAMSDALHAGRMSQAEAVAGVTAPPARTDVDASFLELMEKLRQAVKDRPDDLRGQELLARNEAALGNLGAAVTAQQAVIAAKADAATAEDHAGLAELMIFEANGYVSPEAEAALIAALEKDPENGTARYYTGAMFAQVGRFDRTFVLWRRLLDDGPADAPWVTLIRAQIEDVASRAGVSYTLPPQTGGPRGPSDSDMTAAAELSPEERQAMIVGMVEQLSERLAREGGSAEEWARLISSLAMIGRMDDARSIYAEAQTRFAGQSVELSGLREAAVTAGVAE